MATKFHPVAAPAVLHSSPATVSVDKNSSWAGYEDVQTQPNYFHTVQAIYTEPHGYSSSCSGNGVAVWTGLGGDSGSEGTTAWGQAGTTIGRWRSGLSPNQAWIEVFNESGDTTVNDTPIYATPGSEFEVTVTRVADQSYQWVFFLDNLATGKSLSVAATYSAPNGFTTAQYVVEKGPNPLENFETINFDDVSVAAQHYPVTTFSYKQLQLYKTQTYQLARTNGLTDGGHAFSVTQLHCN